MTKTPAKKKPTKRVSAPRRSPARRAKYILRLYINDSTVKSKLAVANLKRVCEQHLKGRYELEVIDIHRHPNLARDEQIVALPTLIKKLPVPLQLLVGDMSDLSKMVVGLNLRVRKP